MSDYERITIWSDLDGSPVFRLQDGSDYGGPLFAWAGNGHADEPLTEWRTVDRDGKTAIEGGSPDFGVSTLNELDTRYPDYAPFRIQTREVTEWVDA